ncbi:hypothetical protein TPHA_0G03280 [Tetrapisispora phaffii CBS 4417]|uniref:Uncharacterized protein n=1 Tax=Tetrapisispora phaffii (strain ATCC 24235 / CBS 4417 / NBRC 1672 / NRRL Y-8282 / UCD 70-5) TaxID=1071381 RepID=G8BW90_TETPH|nr:hypothetical protein TPHA_0G03280 [Tetrapisispora phaffii CBS 4417]CCE64168.1 hypothetical protein TPHA_0G03280 [Tetrapisispora phaffii CBS 4417]
MCSEIEQVITDLISEDPYNCDKSRVLVFVLGDESRVAFEKIVPGALQLNSSIGSVLRSRNDIDILFLNKPQVLFMYLMKLDALENGKESIDYNYIIFYGLDCLIKEINNKNENHGQFDLEQVRLSNLIYNIAFRIKRKHSLKGLRYIPLRDDEENTSNSLRKIEEYWETVC